ncbi:DUF4153 domain-containing protein [Pedobacter sp. JY14-1]|uniref:DUF4153 domain-containing protein n=1 Tax=Pedobacter sp. JY14-1 TaxID=3034151 RepID=UPI0023E0E88C|nr:DUF4153 domain-containing protein [Pedobacter sp. JY14-1]
MKLPSVQQFCAGLLMVVRRFPLQFLCAVFATACWCICIHLSEQHTTANEALRDDLIKAVLVSNMVLTLLLALDLFAEANGYSPGKKWVLRCLGVLCGLGLFFLLSPVDNIPDAYRTALLAFAFHLLVAFAPFIGKDDVGAFWQYNKMLFLRILVSGLYSVVLFAGLAIALFAVKGLFNVKVHDEAFLMLFAVITAGFNTLFFLAGVPAVNLNVLAEDKSYPKGLKVFTQFVLIPLMSIYLAILLVYELKILLLWELPKGLVSSLILGYAVFGILSLLLVYPVKEADGNQWIKLFSRFFYIMLIPLVILLVLAIWKRVDHYGITESRYVLIVLALWLSGITLYFLLSGKENIKVIPVSLCILVLLTVYGPQSISSLSKSSQLARLRKLMTSDRAADQYEKPSVIRYLVNVHGLKSLQPFTTEPLAAIEAKISRQRSYRYAQKEQMVDTILAILKVKDERRYQAGIGLSLINDENKPLKIKGYDYLIEMNTYPQPATFTVAGHKLTTEGSRGGSKLMVRTGDTTLLHIDLSGLFNTAAKDYQNGVLKPAEERQHFYYPAKKMRFSRVMGQFEYTVVIASLEGTFNNDHESDDRNYLNSKSYLLIRELK